MPNNQDLLQSIGLLDKYTETVGRWEGVGICHLSIQLQFHTQNMRQN